MNRRAAGGLRGDRDLRRHQHRGIGSPGRGRRLSEARACRNGIGCSGRYIRPEAIRALVAPADGLTPAIDDPEPYVPGSFDDVILAYDLGQFTDHDYLCASQRSGPLPDLAPLVH